MTFTSKTVFAVVFSLLFLSVLPAAFAGEDESRTSHRQVLGITHFPAWILATPPHDEFTSRVSNQDVQRQHPAATAGQEWDTKAWTAGWTPEIAIHKFFKARIFNDQYMRRGGIPVVELGPAFYKLSDLDQRRTLKLLTDYFDVFGQGYDVFELGDWSTRDMVGTYTRKGMLLN